MHTQGQISSGVTGMGANKVVMLQTPPREVRKKFIAEVMAGKEAKPFTSRRVAILEPSPYMGLDECRDNGERLAAAWNAAEGVETKNLTPGLMLELIEAVKGIEDFAHATLEGLDGHADSGHEGEAWARLVHVIDKVKGIKT